MSIESTVSGEIRTAAPSEDHQTAGAGNLAQQSDQVAPGLEKIAAAVDLLRLEMQGIRLVLEALVAKG